VREYLQAQLVQSPVARPLDPRPQQRRAHAAAAPATVDQHGQVAETEAADLHMEHPDDPAARDRDDRGVRGARELRGPLPDVDWRLGRDPVALLRHGGEDFRHRARITRARRPYHELCHGHILAARLAAEGHRVMARRARGRENGGQRRHPEQAGAS